MNLNVNIILFGEAGVGKSSVINLIATKQVSVVSPNVRGGTLGSQQYTIQFGGKVFKIWDTIGLGEPILNTSGYLGAIEQTYALIQQIEAKGRLDLLLFCIRGSGSRVTQTMLCNYRLFFEVLCERRIPISVVVTRLEGEERMENWWDRNERHISQSGLEFGGHACVTGIPGHPKAGEGRAALRSLLLSCDSRGRYPMLSPERFSGSFEHLPIASQSKTTKDRQKELERLLHDRCMMSNADARRLARNLTHARLLVRGPSSSEPLRHPRASTWASLGWLKTIFSSAHDDGIVVFLIGPSGSGKSTFVRAVTQSRNLVRIGPILPPSARNIQAVRCRLTEEARAALRVRERTNIVFLDVPSFFLTRPGGAAEMSIWLKRSRSKSSRFGTIYMHRIEIDPGTDKDRLQRQLDTFAGNFPVDVITRAFPQRLHCVLSCVDVKEPRIARHQEKFQKQLAALRPTVANERRWETSTHPDLFVIRSDTLARGDPDMAWKAVKALFSSPGR